MPKFHAKCRLEPLARLTILHTNDLHGALTPEKAARIRELKEANAPCLYFDSGDCIRAGNLAIPLKQEQAWALLTQAGCDASTLGNRESHPLEPAFRAKLAGARNPLLVANMRRKGDKGTEGQRDQGTRERRDGGTEGRGDEGTEFSAPTHPLSDSPSPHLITPSSHHPFPGAAIFDRADIRVGVIGVMVPMVTERMKTAFASAYLWDNPIEAVKRELAILMRSPEGSASDLLIALTHIGINQDRRLAEVCPELDLILGGHSHTLLERPEKVGNTWICQGGSHGRFIGRYVWDAESGLIEAELLAL